jgi:hypothetical protein
MLQRFVSGSSVAAVLIACGASTLVLLTRLLQLNNPYLLGALWCLLPAAWGVWAMLAPASWVPNRLPQWGAILGLLIAIMAAFVLDIPLRIFGLVIPVPGRVVAVVFAIVVYYFLWMIVRKVYQRLLTVEDRIRAIPL